MKKCNHLPSTTLATHNGVCDDCLKEQKLIDGIFEIKEKELQVYKDTLLEKIKGVRRDALSQFCYQGAPTKAEVARQKLIGEGYKQAKDDIIKLLK